MNSFADNSKNLNFSGETNHVRFISLTGDLQYKNALVQAILLAVTTVKAGGYPNSLSLNLNNYYWDEKNPNRLVLTNKVGQSGVQASIEFKDGQRLDDDELVKFMKAVSNGPAIESKPSVQRPKSP